MSALLSRIQKNVESGKTANPTQSGGALLSRINKRSDTDPDILAFQQEFERDYMADWGNANIKFYADVRNKVVNAMRYNKDMSYQAAWDMTYSLLNK